jgi:hypothetical protein
MPAAISTANFNFIITWLSQKSPELSKLIASNDNLYDDYVKYLKEPKLKVPKRVSIKTDAIQDKEDIEDEKIIDVVKEALLVAANTESNVVVVEPNNAKKKGGRKPKVAAAAAAAQVDVDDDIAEITSGMSKLEVATDDKKKPRGRKNKTEGNETPVLEEEPAAKAEKKTKPEKKAPVKPKTKKPEPEPVPEPEPELESESDSDEEEEEIEGIPIDDPVTGENYVHNTSNGKVYRLDGTIIGEMVDDKLVKH